MMSDICAAKVMIISMLISIFDNANKEEKALVVKPGLLNFNYWKRTGKAGCATGLFYCIDGVMGKTVSLPL